MNKKIISLIIGILIIAGICITIYLIMNNSTKETNNKQSESLNEGEISGMNNGALVLYFSATGTTKKVAEIISKVTGGKLIEIISKNKYTSEDLNYNNDNCRANVEQNDESARPEIENIINIDDYETIYIGYPIWWETNPRIIQTLFDSYNFENKKVALFATSGGSGISQSENDLKNYKNNINFIGSKLFNGSVSNSDVEYWINNLNK